MDCENKFCIYWKKNKCILDEIELDRLGCCQSCIYVDLDEATLEENREIMLKKMEGSCADAIEP